MRKTFLPWMPCLLLPVGVRADAGADGPPQLGTVTVIGVAPEAGAELPENLIPYNVQSAGGEDFERAQVLDATDYLDRHMTGVTTNSTQNNPLQPDLQFRGFTASPLLGGAEGISVYLDGVRVNEVFGDTVNWDLIPEEAMARMTLMTGANPLFGLNTLGGAILIQTKNGFTDPGTHAESYAGSFGRNETTLTAGGNNRQWGYYVLANHFEERGWRDLSNSNAGTWLGTLSWRGDRGSVDLHLSHAQTKLTGNGPQAIQVLAAAPRSVFTAPDRTQNFYSGVTAQASYRLSDEVALSATLFARQVNTRTLNGDATDFGRCPGQDFLCDADGASVFDQDGNPVPASDDAINNTGVRKQRSSGGSLQATFKQDLFGWKNQFVAGLDVGHGRVNYRSIPEASYLLPFAGDPGFTFVTAANTGIFVPDDALAVRIAEDNAGIYSTDTLSLTDRLALTLSARYNHTHTVIADAGGNNPDLDGAHAFHRVNPAAGLTWQFSRTLNFYAGYSESTRAPTPVELTCASPDAPCKLPNEFIADPDLQQVVARSIEGGLRGNLDAIAWHGSMHWQAGFFRTVNAHDIIFQSTGGARSNEGYFANVGDTRRQGVEVSLRGQLFEQRLDWHASYAYIDATFRTPFSESSAHHPDADPDTGLIAVTKGSRMPGVPRDALKLGLDYRLSAALGLGGDIVYNSARRLRGDEANRLAPLGGYAVVNLRGDYRVTPRLGIFLRINNLFDRRYSNFGALGDATRLHADFTDPRFVSPGAPRGSWIGVSVDY